MEPPGQPPQATNNTGRLERIAQTARITYLFNRLQSLCQQLRQRNTLANRLANKLAERHTATMGDTRAMHRVIHAEEVTLSVANRVQTSDGLVVSRASLRVIVDMNAKRNSQNAAH